MTYIAARYKRGAAYRIGVVSRIFLILTLKASLDLATVLVSSKALGIYSITLKYDAWTFSIGYIAALLLAISLPSRTHSIDSLIMWLLAVFIGLPLIIPYQLGGESFVWMTWCVSFFCLLGLQMRVRLLNITALDISYWWWPLSACFLVIAGYSMLTSMWIVGLTPTLDLSVVYDIRNQFLASNIPLANYFYTWTAYLMVPLVMTLGQIRKKMWLVLLALLCALILFFATGHKIFLFAPPFVYALNWSIHRKNPQAWIVLGLSALVLAGTLAFYTFGDIQVNATFSNRLFVLPAKISYEYYNYFGDRPKVFLSHSILARALDYPYHVSPIELISSRYYGSADTRPNTGIIADAFMNFGYGGVLVLAVFVAGVLRILRWLSLGRDRRLVVCLIAVPIFQWVNVGFLTSFLTGGVALGLLGIFCLPQERGRREKSVKKFGLIG